MRRHSFRFSSALTLVLAGILSAKAHTQGLPPPPGSGAPDTPATAASGPSAFDVVSVHEHSADDHMMRWMNKGDSLTTENIPLQSLIAMAYNVKMYLITGGPSWLNNKGFDIQAKVLPGADAKPVDLTQAQMRVLVRALLADRFRLQAHVESKILPVYDLTVAKGGPKLKIAPPDPPSEDDGKPHDLGDIRGRGSASFAPGHFQAHAYKMGAFAENLGYQVQRTVVDKTGLTGEYDIDLTWTPEEQLQAAGDKAATGTDLKPSIYAALQEQLGLKLVPSKGPVDTLVIDHLDLPTAN